MTHRHGPPWGRGKRPTWWPQSEEWPPRGRWITPPARFFVRMAVFAIIFFLVLQLAIAAFIWTVSSALGAVGVPVGAQVFVALALPFLIFLAMFVRSFRRAAAPIGDLMEAAERVADGDYAARVRPRGPREVRRLVESFNAMSERLERGEQERKRLLADVTHELRTPLSVIQGQLEGAIDGVYARDEAHLGTVLDETRHMARIIEDLRILSLAESGALRLDRRPTSLDDVVDDAIDAQSPPATAAGVEITSTVPLDLPPVDVDPTRLREVLDNLLSNALRYTLAGGTVAVSAHRDGPSHVRVIVSDTGRGIAPDDLPLIFDRFHKDVGSRGTGLGLAIARDLVRAHGGEIEAQSDGEGRGTTIRFTLPIALEG
ncbi:MAG TPA: HAMP domain-containing sensor histidine kinase [Candidatus Limnocylindria bacterium]